MSYAFNWKGSDIIITFTGELNLNEFIVSNEEIYDDPRFDSMRYQICNLREVENINIEPREVKLIGTLDRISSLQNDNIKLAILANENQINNEHFIGLIELYKGFLIETNWSVLIFDNIVDAEKWCEA